MIKLSRFSMYYYSEVSADILYRYRPEYGTYKISATHPNSSVPVSDWFHFSDHSLKDREDPLYFESESRIEPLALMAEELHYGPKMILSDVDEISISPRRQFFSDFMCALTYGEYSLYDNRAKDYHHEAGDWLMQKADKLS